MSKREQIKQDLLDQLEENGVEGEHWVDLVDDYMSLWDIKNNLIDDIMERGVNIRYQNGENQYGWKKNDSVGNLHKTNTQMLKLLDKLGIDASPHGKDPDEIIEL